MKSTVVLEKTTRVRCVFHTSDYEKRGVKDEQLSENSSIFNSKKRKIWNSKRAKIYGHSKYCMWSSSSTSVWMTLAFSEKKNPLEKFSGLHEIERLVWRILVVCCTIVQKRKTQGF